VRGTRRWLPALAVILAAAGSAPGRDAPARVTVEPLGVRPAPLRCALFLGPRFEGTRDSRTGTIAGTWTVRASTTCGQSMLQLSVVARLAHEGSPAGDTPTSECALGLGDPCRAVATVGQASCNPCNGRWRVTSTHLLSFPAAALLAGSAPGCRVVGLNAVSCELSLSTTLG
jgi:hypothetical protein